MLCFCYFTVFILSATFCLLPNCRTLLPHIFCPFIVYCLRETVPLFLCAITQGPCNVSPSFPNGHSSLFFSFWVINNPFSWLNCLDCHTFFDNFPFNFSLELYPSFVKLLQKVPVIFLECYREYSPVCFFLFSHW